MAWTLKNYQDRVAQLALDQSPQPNDVTVWVNECLQELQPFANLEASDTVTLVNGTAAYALPSDWYEPAYIYRQDSTTDDPTEFVSLAKDDRTSTGVRFWNGQIIVQPTPEAADDAKTLYLEYYKTVNQLTNADDSPTIPDEFHDIPFLHACMRAKQQDSEFGEGRDFAIEKAGRMAAFIRSRASGNPSGFQVKTKW